MLTANRESRKVSWLLSSKIVQASIRTRDPTRASVFYELCWRLWCQYIIRRNFPSNTLSIILSAFDNVHESSQSRRCGRACIVMWRIILCTCSHEPSFLQLLKGMFVFVCYRCYTNAKGRLNIHIGQMTIYFNHSRTTSIFSRHITDFGQQFKLKLLII